MSSHTPEIESVFMKYALKDERYFAAVDKHFDVSFLTDGDFKVTYENLRTFHKTYGRLPNSSEISLLNGRKGLTTMLAVAEKVGDIEEIGEDILFEKTREYLREKNLYKTLKECAEAYKNSTLDPNQALKKFEDLVSISFDNDFGIELFDNITEIEASFREEEARLKTGWSWLDKNLRGGWRAKGKSLYIFQGAANVGKSIWLGNVATNIVRQGKNVLLLSFEMSELLYAERLVSDLTKVKIAELKSQEEGSIKRKADSLKENTKCGKLFVKEFPPDTITVPELKGFIEKFVASGRKIDAIVIDYLTLIKGSDGSSSYERGKEVAVKLRALSYIFGVPIITATQIGRGKNKSYGSGQPELDDISESLAIVQTADAIFGIWQEEGDADLGNMNLAIIKSREGKKGMKTQFKISYTTLSITEDKFTVLDSTKMKAEDIFEKVSDKTSR